MTELSDAAVRGMARVMARKATSDAISEDQAIAFAHAVEHLEAAVRALPSPQAEDGEHALALMTTHAHVKAANQYLERARKAVPLASDADDDSEMAEAADDPESRAIRQTTRAAAAVMLNVAGNQAAAKRLIRRTPSPRKPRR